MNRYTCAIEPTIGPRVGAVMIEDEDGAYVEFEFVEEVLRKDSLKTFEINVLVTENKKLLNIISRLLPLADQGYLCVINKDGEKMAEAVIKEARDVLK